MSEHVVDVGKRHIKEINQEIQAACARGDDVLVWSTRCRGTIWGLACQMAQTCILRVRLDTIAAA